MSNFIQDNVIARPERPKQSRKEDSKLDCFAVARNDGIAVIRGLTHEGRGIADVNGKTVFIERALPGETVQYKILKRKRNYDEAETISIENPSPDRVEPLCPHFEICGGCSLQHMSSAAQIALKQKVLLEQLQHFGKLTVKPTQILPPLLSPIWGYRRKARLGVRYVAKKEKVLIGFREKNSSKLADINRCEILHPSVGHLIPELQSLIRSLSVFEHIPQIEVAVGDSETALVFRIMKPMTEEDKEKCISFAKKYQEKGPQKHERQIHLYLQPGGIDTIKALYPENVTRLNYSLSINPPMAGINFSFHPVDFTQVNATMNQQMVQRAIELLDLKPEDKVLDLFCGLGNFSLPMAKYAGHVVGVEGSQEMVDRAIENAKNNNINNADFLCANLHDESFNNTNSKELNINNINVSPWGGNAYSKILLDPPRSGALEMMSLIPKLNPERIVYVSCNPATMARDLGELVHKHGFSLEVVGIMDMFPHTTHVESIAMLRKI